MQITDALVLPDDVQVMPVSELPADVRENLTWDEGDYAVIRPGTRMPVRILDAMGV